MKKYLPLLLLLLASPAWAKPNFYAGAAAHPQTPVPSTIPDPPAMGAIPDLTTALANMSLDELLATVQQGLTQGNLWTAWGQASLITLGANQAADETKETSDFAVVTLNIGNLQTALSAAQAQIIALQVPVAPVPVSAGYTLHLEATQTCGSSAAPKFQANTGADQGYRLQLVGVGSYYDFCIDVPAAGNYALSGRVATSTIGTVPLTVHLEAPVGTNAGTLTVTPAVSGWATPSGGVVTLSGGKQRVRLVVDSLANGNDFLNYLELVKQ